MADDRPRARDLGIPLEGTPGSLNAITDVPGITVGHTTIIEGDGKLVVGEGPVRTGVTAIFPRGAEGVQTPVFAGTYALNGNGEMTGTIWVEEGGQLAGPITITNTHSVGVVRDSVIEWLVSQDKDLEWSLPVTAETWDGSGYSYQGLNDANGFHVKKKHVFNALDTASSGPVTEGSVGGGTGMVCNEFKGGIGTSSRVIEIDGESYAVGVLVQCNYGLRSWLKVAGVPVGMEMEQPKICVENAEYWREGSVDLPCDRKADGRVDDTGSIIVVVATDAPLLPHQLKRVARRVGPALGRLGSFAGNGSGDIFIAFSTANAKAFGYDAVMDLKMVPNSSINPVFEGAVLATEEAVVNSMLAADTMIGADTVRVPGLPHAELQRVLREYNRLNELAD
ncbi:MAG: P1 family peptidase [Gammaproteobacteria bacterium]|nr:P1 family peptidase [Gammaproteobacteria bacterium]